MDEVLHRERSLDLECLFHGSRLQRGCGGNDMTNEREESCTVFYEWKKIINDSATVAFCLLDTKVHVKDKTSHNTIVPNLEAQSQSIACVL